MLRVIPVNRVNLSLRSLGIKVRNQTSLSNQQPRLLRSQAHPHWILGMHLGNTLKNSISLIWIRTALYPMTNFEKD